MTATRRPRRTGKTPLLPPRPTDIEIAAARVLLEPWAWLTSPKFYGLSRVPQDRPVFLVGNHTLMGVLDVPLLVLGLYEQRGVFLRALGDHLHFAIPLWRDLLSTFGAVDGTRDNSRALMRAGESLLVFPGGGREVFKRKGEKYHLLWKNRIGFARLAVEFGYTIVPFSAVGAEECYDIVVDGNDLLKTPLGPAIERFSPRPEMIPPLVRGIGFTPLPRPQRFYFHFGKPIETTHLASHENDEAACFALREDIRAAVEHGIHFLLAQRRRDPQRMLPSRIFDHLRSLANPLSAKPRRARPSQSKASKRRRTRPPW